MASAGLRGDGSPGDLSPEVRKSGSPEVGRVAIVGGGIGGLSLAFRLVRSGIPAQRITIFEAGPRLGGLIQSTRRDGFLIEHGPDSILRAKPAGIALWDELGLSDQIVGTEPSARTAMIARGKQLFPVPEGLYLLAPGKIGPLLRTPLLSWRGKLRAGMDLILPRRSPQAPEESLGQFVRRRFGRELFERIAQPLAAGIYTADPEKLSVAATMPQFLAWEQEHRSLILAAKKRQRDEASGSRYGLFASLRDGLHSMVNRLHEQLGGVDIRLNTAVTGLARHDGQWQVASQQGARQQDTVTASHIALCGPAHLAAQLLQPVDEPLASELSGIPYAGAVILNLAFPRQALPDLPMAAGFVVPYREGRQILAATFMSQKYADRAPADTVLLRVFLGGAGDSKQLQRSDAELVAAACVDLRELVQLNGRPLWYEVDRWPLTMAQYHLGHRDRVAHIRTRSAAIPGLALIGNGYEGVGIPDIIAQANHVAAGWLARSE